MATIKERYAPVPLAANGSWTTSSQESIGGFIAVTAGTLTVQTRAEAPGSSLVTVVNALPVSAGVYYPLPMYLGVHGGAVTLAGGASGTLLV